MTAYHGTDYEPAVLQWIQRRGYGTRREVQEYLGVSLSTANRVLVALMESGKIHKIGRGKNTRYEIHEGDS